MSTKLTEIKGQHFSSILGDFCICGKCKIVYRDMNSTRLDYKCAHCGNPTNGARMYLPQNVLVLMDLMQEFYNLKNTIEPRSNNNRIAVVIFYCTLVEVLLYNYFKELMTSQNIPFNKQKKLFDDNLSVSKRVKELYPSLTGEKWDKTIKKFSGLSDIDYDEACGFYLKMNDIRNKFLHGGNKWCIKREMPEQCIENIWPIVNLFVALHNKYIAQKIEPHSDVEV